jgi:hypothetical protein
MGNYNFQQDLVAGKAAEKRVLEILSKKCDGIVDAKPNDDYRYDWKIRLDNGMDVTVEVKNDAQIETTGNFAFELRCRGKASGVNVTTADMFVVYCHENGEEHAYYFKTDWLKNMILTWNCPIVRGGDTDEFGNPVVDMMLVSKKRLLDIYNRPIYEDIAAMERFDLRKISMEK